jgi:hypothetical protein
MVVAFEVQVLGVFSRGLAIGDLSASGGGRESARREERGISREPARNGWTKKFSRVSGRLVTKPQQSTKGGWGHP